MNDREAMQMALDALEELNMTRSGLESLNHEIEALRTALAQPEKEWVGLTDEEMLVAAFQAGFDVHEDYDNEDDPDALHCWSEDGDQCDYTLHKLRDIIEAKLKEKNG